MKTTTRIAAALAAMMMTTPAMAKERWTVGYGHGFMEHGVENGPGNGITIACNQTSDIGSTSIDITIIGKGPPPGSNVKIILTLTSSTSRRAILATSKPIATYAPTPSSRF
jgi:hypothetical protein